MTRKSPGPYQITTVAQLAQNPIADKAEHKVWRRT